MKKRLARQFESLAFYYQYLGYRVIVTVTLSIAVGVLDGFGLSMFMPLLQMVSGTEEAAGASMGKLSFIVEGLESIGIGLNLMSVLAVMVVFFLFKGVAMFFNVSYRIIIRNLFIKKLRTRMVASFNQLSYKYFVTADVGRIQNTMSGEVERVSRSFQDYFRTAEQAILVIVYMSFAFLVDAQFALLVTIGGWLTNFLYQLIYKKTRGLSTLFTDDSHGYQGQIIQYVANFKYLKATNLLNSYSQHLNESIDKIEQSRKKMGILNAIVGAAREPLLILIVAFVILLQTQYLNAPLGPILISLLFFYRALTALMNMQNSWNRFLEVSGSLSNVINFQEQLMDHQEVAGVTEYGRFKDELIIENGWFAYGEEFVLKDIQLSIKRNQITAFVGKSGSGKTTLVNILAGLMPLDKGRFTIDGADSRKISLGSYQDWIGYITQEPVIFSDTIFNNVTFWAEKNEKNRTQFNKAIQQASIREFVESLCDKEDTILGVNGVNLSGGQKQRISIARELYKDPDILILDEATSALDSETEKAIQESINLLKGEYTILIVAHRLSTIKNTNQIIFLKGGMIQAKGNYSDLLNKNIGFKHMVSLQEL